MLGCASKCLVLERLAGEKYLMAVWFRHDDTRQRPSNHEIWQLLRGVLRLPLVATPQSVSRGQAWWVPFASLSCMFLALYLLLRHGRLSCAPFSLDALFPLLLGLFNVDVLCPFGACIKLDSGGAVASYRPATSSRISDRPMVRAAEAEYLR